MSEQILAAKIKAFDEFSATFQRYEQSLRKLGQTQNATSQSTEKISKSTRDFLSVLGGVGALYAFQRGMQVVAQTGREFELAIKQAQAVTGNLTNDLRDMAMATKGIYGPTEAAKAYYELGSAGLATNEILRTTPDVLNFATAGMLKMEDSAYAVSSTVKAFGLEWGQTTQVVDAFTQAMNSTAMKAEDFKWVMGTVGAVGKMAGQDFKEVIGAAAAMRDAGVQAQDAGTSVKSALLAMINPSDEAQKTIEALGLKFYDSAGKMKQWHEIIAEYERVLAPYNEQSRNLIMTTIAGSDGIRALSTGLRMGSANLGEYVNKMGQADGATKTMADTMSNSFDGAIREMNAEIEKAKILLFEDFSKGAVGLAATIKGVVETFNSMDGSTRRFIESLVGGAGLAAAILIVVSGIQKLAAAIELLELASGPWGWIALAIGVAGAAIFNYTSNMEEAAQKQRELNVEAVEFDRIAKEGIDKSQIDATKDRIKAMDDEIAKLKERQQAIKENIDYLRNNPLSNPDSYAISESDKKKYAELGAQIQDLTNKQNILNGAVEKATVLDTQATQGIANKAVQEKLEVQEISTLSRRYIELAAKKSLNNDESKELSSALATLAAKYPFLISEVDKHGNATKLNTKALAEQANMTSQLAQAQYVEAMNSIMQQRAKTQDFITQTTKRIEMIDLERRALLTSSSYNQQMLSDFGQQNQATTALDKQRVKQKETDIKLLKKQVEEYKRAAATMGDILNTAKNMKVSSGGAGVKIWTPPEDPKKSKEKDAPDPFDTAMATFNYQKEMQNMTIDAQIAGLKKIRDNFAKNGKWTLEQHRQIDTQIVQLTRQRVQEQLNYSRNWIETQKALNKLSTEDEIAAWQRVKAKYKLSREEMAQIDVQIYQLQEQARKEQVDKAKAWIEEQVFYNRMGVVEQVKAWQQLKANYKLTADEIKEVDRQIYNLRKEQADKMVDIIRTQYEKERDAALENLEEERDEEEKSLDKKIKAYEKFHQQRMDQLDAETEAQVNALKEQIDAINNLNKQDEDAKKEADRNQKLGDLQTEYDKYKGATSAAGKKKLAEIEQEMADIQYEIQQEALQKQREEQVNALQSEIDRINQQAEAKKELWQAEYDAQQDHYQELRDNLQKHYESEMESTRAYWDARLTEESLRSEALKALQNMTQDEILKNLNDKAPFYQKAGEILGQSLADGLSSKVQAVRDAAKKLADVMSDYLELHSPAKKGPLSNLDEWFKPFGKTLASGMGFDPLLDRISDVLPKPSSGATLDTGGFKLEIYINEFIGTQENIKQFWSEGKRVFDSAQRARGRG